MREERTGAAMRTLLITSLLCTAMIAPAATADRPNIVFIMSDDHAAHAIGAYGSRVNQTPNIDRLAREGMLLRERVRDQLDLHAEPGGDSHRPVLAPQWRAGVQPVRQLAPDGRDACCSRAATTPA